MADRQRSAPDRLAPTLGVLMLDTRFPRPVGDVGNPDTWSFPVEYQRLSGVGVDAVVRAEGPPDALIERFSEAAGVLADKGARLITTSCGFLAPVHQRVVADVAVPFVSTALMQIPLLRRIHGPERAIGVLTFDAEALSRIHFGPGWDDHLVIQGLAPGSHLARVIREDQTDLDGSRAEAEVLAAAERLAAQAADLCCVVLECTNLPPYRAAVQRVLGLPVHDLVTLVNWTASSILSAEAATPR